MGIFLVLLLLGGLTGAVAANGVAVKLDSEELAAVIRERIKEQARTEMPKVIAEAKAEIPAIVEKEMESQFASDRMEIAGFVFRMPEELVNQLKSNMQQNVERATGEILDGIDTNQLAEKFGEDAYRLVQETVQAELNGQNFEVMVLGRYPLRVTIHID